MDRYGPSPMQRMPGGGGQSASRPGMGTGGIPFAPGMISGNFGQANRPRPQPRGQGSDPSQQPEPAPPPQGPGGPYQGQRPGPQGPPGAGLGIGMAIAGNPQTPFLQPQFLFEIYNIIMSSFLQAAQGDGMPWGYTY